MSDTIAITGNVATDPERKQTNGGVAITSFRVASAQRRFDRTTNTWVDSGTNWYSVSAFRGLAEHAHASLRRGDRVVIIGRLRVRDWDNGTKRGTDVEIDVESIGHDLLWGTSVFTKVARTPAPERESSWEPAPAPADAWATPGASEEGSATDWPTPDEPRPRELVGSETPF